MSLLPDLGAAIGGPLVAPPVSVSSPFDGLWLVQDGMALADAIGSGNWVEGGMAAFSLLLDGAAALIDPIGTLIGMGLSWVLEHIWPLNEYLNALTGNAGEVLRMSQTWSNISTHLAGAGSDLDRFLGDLESLEGAAMDAYRQFQHDVAEHIQLAGALAAATSTALEIASTIVKIVHDLTRDVISQIAGTAISAALTTVVTVGFGAPVAIAQVAARVAALVPKVTRAIEAVIRSFEKLEPLLKQVDKIYYALQRLLNRLLPGYHGPTGQHAPGYGEPWDLKHPRTQEILDDLKAAANNGPPGYDRHRRPRLARIHGRVLRRTRPARESPVELASRPAPLERLPEWRGGTDDFGPGGHVRPHHIPRRERRSPRRQLRRAARVGLRDTRASSRPSLE